MDIWLRTTQMMKEETRCRNFMRYVFRLETILFSYGLSTNRILCTIPFVLVSCRAIAGSRCIQWIHHVRSTRPFPPTNPPPPPPVSERSTTELRRSPCQQKVFQLTEGKCSSVVRKFAHGAMCFGSIIHARPIELFLAPASAPWLE